MADWFYTKNGQQVGPIAAANLKRSASDGQIAPTDLVWREGLAQWVNASQVRGLFPEPQGASPLPIVDDLSALPGGPPYAPPAQTGYVAPQAGYAAPQAGYAAPQAGYADPQAGYAAPQAGYTAPQPYYGGAPQVMGYQQAPAKNYKGMALTAMILGIVGLLCFGFITGTLAVILGGIALSGMGRTNNSEGKGMAVAGIVLGVVDIVGWIVWLSFFYSR